MPDVIPAGQHVNAEREQLPDQARCDTPSGGGVFRVGHHQFQFVLLDEIGYMIAENPPARLAKDVANKENVHPITAFWSSSAGAGADINCGQTARPCGSYFLNPFGKRGKSGAFR